MMVNKISDKGVLEIAEHEGFVLGPYLDSVGVKTVWVGHTAAAGGPDPTKMPMVDTRGWSEDRVTEELVRGLRQFDTDLDSYEGRVNRAVKVDLKQHEFDALVSFDFNTGGIFKAQLTKSINGGDRSGGGFMGWIKPKEIIKRRKAEQSLFRTGNYDANGDDIPVYDALPNGKIKHRMTIDGAKLAALMSQAGAKRNVPQAGPAKSAPVTTAQPSSGLWKLIAALLRGLFGAK